MNYAHLLSVSAALLALTQAASAQTDDVYARAEAETRIVTTALEDGRYRTIVPLASVREQQGGMRLQGANAGEDLSVAIAPQARTDSARLLLRHATSRAQEGALPHIRIGVNNQFAAQVDSGTGLTPVLDEITMDGRIFRTGFNNLRLDALQRYTFDCQDPTAAELWTEIDTQRSSLELTYQRREFTGTLADLDMFMSPGVGGVERLVVVTGGAEPTDKHLRWGALAVQAVTNRMHYRLPEIVRAPVNERMERATSSSPAPGLAIDARRANGADLLLVGTFEELAGTLAIDPASIEADDGYLAVGPSPYDDSHFIIVLSGHTDEAVDRAVRALGMNTFPFAATETAQIGPDDSPYGMAGGARAPLTPGATYALADLGYRTSTSIGAARASNSILFELPADFFAREQDEVILSLDFAYGAALESDSVLNILVNGIFRRAIALSNPDGEASSGYQIRLPARVFSPGKNVLRFDAELSKDQTGACSTRNDRNLAFVLEDSSLIRLPNSPSYVDLPNLQLMASTSFPYSAAGGRDFTIQSASRSDEAIAATWTVAAKLAQAHGAQFTGARFSFDASPGEQDTLLVGARPSLSGLLANQTSRKPDSDRNDPFMVRALTLKDTGRGGFIIAGENPSQRDTLLTVVTAANDASLLQSVRELVEPSHWSQLRGEGAVWRANPASVATFAATNIFHTGNIHPADRVAYENGRASGRWVFLIGALLFAIAIALAFVGRYMRQRADSK